MLQTFEINERNNMNWKMSLNTRQAGTINSHSPIFSSATHSRSYLLEAYLI